MTTARIVPVILSGGAGTRLWPVSRATSPKQLHALASEKSMLQETLERADGLPNVGPPIVVTGRALADRIEHTLSAMGSTDHTLVLEPFGRNTAPAVAIAALELTADGDDALMLVLPADHVITDVRAFAAAVSLGTSVAEAGRLVTFGITPTAAETGYGYIRRADPIADGVYEIAEFKEKPDRETAESYVASGAYAWNSGMFLLGASTFLDELRQLQPEMAASCEDAYEQADRTPNRIQLEEASFGAVPGESIDFAVMEHTQRGAVIPANAGWSDVGSWSSLWELGSKDSSANVMSGDVIARDAHNNLIVGSTKVIGVAGVDGLVVVDTPDALLVTSVDRSQEVKQIVDALAERSDPTVVSDGTTIDRGVTRRVQPSMPGVLVEEVAMDPNTEIHLTNQARHHIRVLKGSGDLEPDEGEAQPLVPESETSVFDGGDGVIRAGINGLRLVHIGVDTTFEPTAVAAFFERRGNT